MWLLWSFPKFCNEGDICGKAWRQKTEQQQKSHEREYESEHRSIVSDSLRPPGLRSPWNSPGQKTGVGSRSLFQGIFPTQGLNPGLPHCRRILYQLSHQGSPRILEWVAFPFSRGSSQPRNWTGVSCIAGRFFTNWAIREAQIKAEKHLVRNNISAELSRTGLLTGKFRKKKC